MSKKASLIIEPAGIPFAFYRYILYFTESKEGNLHSTSSEKPWDFLMLLTPRSNSGLALRNGAICTLDLIVSYSWCININSKLIWLVLFHHSKIVLPMAVVLFYLKIKQSIESIFFNSSHKIHLTLYG